MLIDWINMIIIILRRDTGAKHIARHGFDESVEFCLNDFSLRNIIPTLIAKALAEIFIGW